MPRQTENISTEKGARYECDECERVAFLPMVPPGLGTIDDVARLLGWRMSPDGKPLWCPECTGRDEGYWDREALAVAASRES